MQCLKSRGGRPFHFSRRGSAPPWQVNCSTAAPIQQVLEVILLPVVSFAVQLMFSNFSAIIYIYERVCVRAILVTAI